MCKSKEQEEVEGGRKKIKENPSTLSFKKISDIFWLNLNTKSSLKRTIYYKIL